MPDIFPIQSRTSVLSNRHGQSFSISISEFFRRQVVHSMSRIGRHIFSPECYPLMRSFFHTFTVKANIDKVWEFYVDIRHLQAISPPKMHLEIIKSTHQKLVQGSEVWLTGILVTRSNWHSIITSLAPYEYVDEMITGRFKVWKHIHTFDKIDNEHTEVIDKIEFEMHYGIIGRLFEGIVLSILQRIFDYRQQATIEKVES
jgi:ligand-binding SRPBCC domain-containing protein